MQYRYLIAGLAAGCFGFLYWNTLGSVPPPRLSNAVVDDTIYEHWRGIGCAATGETPCVILCDANHICAQAVFMLDGRLSPTQFIGSAQPCDIDKHQCYFAFSRM